MISILDPTGRPAGSFPAPVLRDSSNDPHTNTSTVNAQQTVAGSAPTYTVTTSIDQEWLADTARVFPVLLDPTTTFGTSLDLGSMSHLERQPIRS